MHVSLPTADYWRPTARTLGAMARICLAQLLVAWVPFDRWSRTLGLTGQVRSQSIGHARRLAADVEWAARRWPIESKCLPRSMALSWMLGSHYIPHVLVVAVRPPELRASSDALHAWVEIGGEIILGDLPGPWIETLRLGGQTQPGD